MNKETVKLLKKARKVLEPEGSWTKKVLARNAVNREVNVDNNDACKFCMIGALTKANTYAYDGTLLRAEKALQFAVAEHYVANVNDRRSTTHLHVLMAYDFAILYAKDM